MLQTKVACITSVSTARKRVFLSCAYCYTAQQGYCLEYRVGAGKALQKAILVVFIENAATFAPMNALDPSLRTATKPLRRSAADAPQITVFFACSKSYY